MAKSFRRPLSPLSVPGYLDIRSEDSPDSDSFPSAGASSAASSSSSSSSATSGASAFAEMKDINVRRSSTEVVLIVVTLIIVVGIISGAILVYKKRGSQGLSSLAFWRKSGQGKAPTNRFTDTRSAAAANPDDSRILSKLGGLADVFNKTQGIFSRARQSEKQNHIPGYDRNISESQQNLIPMASTSAPQLGLAAKVQGAVSGLFSIKPEQKWPTDIEKAAPPPETNDVNVGWPARPNSVTEHSIRTESSMALHPALARIKSIKKPELRSAFSWSTNAPTPIPQSHHSTKDNPLPPVPSRWDNRNSVNRDSVLTTMTEDFEPARHKSIGSWVGNMQQRHDRHQVNQELLETPESQLKAPSAIADPNSANRDTRAFDDTSIRLSAMDSDIQTPAVETATMAFTVPQRPDQPQRASQAPQLEQIPEVPTPASTSHPQTEHAVPDSISEQQQEEAAIPTVAIAALTSPSETITVIREEDWIPEVTRYPSGTTSVSGFPGWKAGSKPGP